MDEMIVDNGGGRQERVRVDYPSNSKKQQGKPEEKPKIEKVVDGVVVEKKKGFVSKLKDAFMIEDSGTVMAYLIADVLVPAAKNTIIEVFNRGLERSLYGDNRAHRPSGGSYTAYSRVREPYSDRRDLSRTARARHDFREIILKTRSDAEEVIDALSELASRYNVASVHDFYDLVGVTGDFTDNKWGWTDRDIRMTEVRVVRGGYLVDLPRPQEI